MPFVFYFEYKNIGDQGFALGFVIEIIGFLLKLILFIFVLNNINSL